MKILVSAIVNVTPLEEGERLDEACASVAAMKAVRNALDAAEDVGHNHPDSDVLSIEVEQVLRGTQII